MIMQQPRSISAWVITFKQIIIQIFILKGPSIENKIQLLYLNSVRSLRWIFLLVTVTSVLTAGLREDTEELIYNHYGGSITLNFLKQTIPMHVKSSAESGAYLRFMADYIYTWEIVKNDSLIGVAYLDNVKGKSQPITFVVFFDPEGQVLNSHIVKYREPIGGEVSSKNWLRQFLGKTKESSFKIGKEIDGISGATISVNAVTRGIHRGTIVIDYLLKKLHD